MPKADKNITDLAGEEWRPVPQFEAFYEVSNLGRVKSIGTGRGRRLRIMRQAVKHHGYRSVCLYRGDGKQTRRGVHRLVLTAFVGECPQDHEACHRNGDTSDNRLENLYWGTTSENRIDTVRHGTHRHSKKTHCPQGHRYDESNTRTYRGGRYCRACNSEHSRNRKARLRQECSA